ncbi:MAG: hypothetical protein KAG61_00230 [Bacteriovoracaceae bacterium]|nr:hypothetical protein [Bacteriovoracaceae bacterium]
MIKNSFIILSLILPLITLKAATHYRAKAPYELAIMAQSLSEELMPKEDRKQILNLFDAFNNLKKVDKTDFLILIKTEIFKEFASLHQNKIANPGLKLSSIEKSLGNLSIKSYGTFSKWFIASLKADVRLALKDLKTIKRFKKARARRIFKKKVSHINKLYGLVSSNSPEHFNSLVLSAMQRVLQRTYNFMLYMDRFSHNKKIDQLNGPIFTSVIIKPKQELEELDQILAPVFSKEEEKNKGPKKWSPADDMTSLRQKNYNVPTQLPVPINDWEYDTEEIIQYVDSNYTPPSNLPTSVDDWELVPQIVPLEKKSVVDPEDEWVIQ